MVIIWSIFLLLGTADFYHQPHELPLPRLRGNVQGLPEAKSTWPFQAMGLGNVCVCVCENIHIYIYIYIYIYTHIHISFFFGKG